MGKHQDPLSCLQRLARRIRLAGDLQINGRRQRIVGAADDHGVGEVGNGFNECHQKRIAKTRQHQGQRHAGEHLPAGGSHVAGGLLHRGINVLQQALQHHIAHGEEGQRLHDYDAPEAVHAVVIAAQQEAGVDACLVVTPYYNKASQKGLIEHYTTIAKSIDLPIIMYNVPSRTGCNILPETAVKLAKEVDNIVAIKAATGNLSQESKTMMLAEGCLDMYSGEDGLIVPLMSIGAKGVISVLSNVAPKQTHDICAEFFAGNVEKSRQLQFEALELVDALFCEVNPIPVKTALNLMGMEVGPLRMPLCEMEEANLNKLKTALKNYGLIK